ncbi:hypothetical protein HETIRDRAFT_456139 [Heterobasidion irregulare TC 32-1]|uniref:DUF5648 domain-containing protein n=1 Tax=Heterobasidion irregulare (strain TC 32-1) TaxID=747525 RepID=W4JPW3_HETIT|nr:uncharacterized protein HETIRDRAFT_456139 [Heterobasidion irregulare TC 32-1]ETW75573.1 hypothetical protein HETIRDRAFT_456139 [Heterobasidion irregulare TC 32-1]
MSSIAAKLKDEGNALVNEKDYEGAIEKDSAIILRLSLAHVSAPSAVQPQKVENRGDEAQNTSCAYPHHAIPLYRVYSRSGTDHFYTTNGAEMVNAVSKLGYAYEGEPGYQGRDHFYTTSASERDNAVNHLGYTDEGIAAYVYATNIRGTIPLYRTYSPGATDHFYTTSASEHDNAVAHLGYNDEGIAAYVVLTPS